VRLTDIFTFERETGRCMICLAPLDVHRDERGNWIVECSKNQEHRVRYGIVI
jgi:hypothetical protein